MYLAFSGGERVLDRRLKYGIGLVILEGSDDVTAADRSGDISDETMLSEEQC